MLHILLFILKIIGIILAVIMGILVLMICVLLFVPVRYEIKAGCGRNLDSLKMRIRITWLLHLIRADVVYKRKGFCWRVRAAWLKRENKGRGKEQETPPHDKMYRETQKAEIEKERKTDIENEIKEDKKIEETGEEYDEVSKECEESREELKIPVKKQQKETEGVEEIPEEESEASKVSEVSEEPEDHAEKRSGFYEKIQKIFQKIKGIFKSFCDRIKALLEKKEKLTIFIQDEVHTAAFHKVKKEAFRLLRRLNPKKLEVRLVYGFEDPCLTGQVLAGISVLYPFMGDHVDITPDFEERILKGKCYIAGKLYAWHFAEVCWNLIWCGNVRKTYRHIKNFQI